jgi:hypothetical protein
VGAPSREVKTIRDGCTDKENTERATASGKDNAAGSNGKERRSSERTETKKKERGEHIDVRHTMLSFTRRRATLNTSGGPITSVRVGKEAAKVLEMGGCTRQCRAGRTGKSIK